MSLMQQIRKSVTLNKDDALFLFAGLSEKEILLVKQGMLLYLTNSDNDIDESMGELEDKYADKDGILHLTYAETDGFGGWK